MDHVVATILLAQRIIRGCDVEQHDPSRSPASASSAAGPREDRSGSARCRDPPVRRAWPPGRRRHGPAHPTSSNRWFMKCPVVLLSLMASLAPASPLSGGGLSSSDIVGRGSSPAQIADLNRRRDRNAPRAASPQGGAGRGRDQRRRPNPSCGISVWTFHCRPGWGTSVSIQAVSRSGPRSARRMKIWQSVADAMYQRDNPATKQ